MINIQQIEKHLIKYKAHCIDCGNNIMPNHMKHYQHSGGVKLDGYVSKRWVYYNCPICKYQNALWKLRLGLQK